MPGATASEVVGAALVPDKILTATARPDVQKTVTEINQFKRETKPQEKIKAVANQKVDMGDAKRAREKIGKSTPSGERDRTDAASADRYKRVGESNDLMEAYFNQGYDALVNADPAKAQQLVDAFKQQYLQSPALSGFSAELSDKNNQEAIDNFVKDKLRDPRFMELAREQFNRATQRGLQLVDTDSIQAEDDIFIKQQNKIDKEGAFNRAKQARENNEKVITDNIDASGTPIGELKAFRDSQVDDDAEHARFVRDEEIAKQKADQMRLNYRRNMNSPDALDSYQHADDEYQAARASRENSRTTQRKKLEQRIDSARGNKQKLEDDERTASRAMAEADRALTKAEAALKQSAENRNNAEDAYVAELEGTVSEAAKEWLQETVDDFSQLVEQRNQKAVTEAEEAAKKDGETNKTKFETATAQTMLHRHGEKRAGGILGRQKYRYNREMINYDYSAFMSDGAEKATFDILKRDAENSGLIAKGASQSEFYAALKKQNIDAAVLQGDIAAQIMQKKFATGGIPKHEIAFLLDTKWGKQAIAKGLELNTEFRSMMKQIDKDGIEKKGLVRRTLKTLRDKPWLTGILFLGMTAAQIAAEGNDEMK